MRRLLAALAVAGAAAAAIVLSGASDGDSSRHWFVEFDNAFGLTDGGDVKVGGVRAGQTTDLTVDDSGERPLARVKLEITESGFDSFREDADCSVRQQSLIGEYFVDCQPGSSERKLPEGGTVPVEQTTSTVPVDLVNNIMRRPFRERFRLILTELGTGLAGRPEDIQEVLKRAHPGLRETSETLRILGRQNRIIQDFIRDSDIVVAELEDRKEDVARWVAEAGETAEISATRRQQLAEQFRKFPRFLDELEPTMARLGELTDEQIPLLRDLRTAAPDLTAFFEELGPFSDASRPSLRSLGRASKVGSRAIRRSQEEIDTLRRLSEDVPGLAKPLRQLLQSLDTRDRATTIDPRARDTAPPEPDPTAISEGEKVGFTGFESIWNYFYWQTLAINGFDEINHLLRVVGFESPCAPYTPDPSAELQRRCGSYLGPYQPGLHEAFDGEVDPDPTDLNDNGIQDGVEGRFEPAEEGRASRSSSLEPTPARPDERRGAGEPEAKPRPGQRDLSQPQVVLPPSIQELIDRLPRLGAPSERETRRDAAPRAGGGAQERLLDFLLSP